MTFPKASELRAKLDAAESQAATKQIALLAEQITAAANEGKCAIRVINFQMSVKAFLESKGYKVQHYQADQRDPR